jgi:hypothetical protein
MIDSPYPPWLGTLVLTASVAACGSSGPGVNVAGDGGSGEDAAAVGSPDAIEDAGPGFSEVYSTIVSGRCLPCHSSGGGVMFGNLDMSTEQTAYANLVGVKAAGVGDCGRSGLTRVVPGSAATSLMFNKVNAKLKQIAPPCGDTMPDDQTVLNQTQVDLIESWINDGAQR